MFENKFAPLFVTAVFTSVTLAAGTVGFVLCFVGFGSYLEYKNEMSNENRN